MAKSGFGMFIKKKFLNKKIKIFIDIPCESLSYADGDTQSYTILLGIPIDYDEDSGVITLINEDKQIFYLLEHTVQIFWDANTDFCLRKNISPVICRKQPSDSDIMKKTRGNF